MKYIFVFAALALFACNSSTEAPVEQAVDTLEVAVEEAAVEVDSAAVAVDTLVAE